MQTNSRSSTPHVPDKVIKDRLLSNAVFYRSSSSWSNDSSHHSVNNNIANREHSPQLITNIRNASPTVHEGEVNAVVKHHVIRSSSENTNDTTSSLERWRARHRTPLRQSNQTVHEANITVTRKDTPNMESKTRETLKNNEDHVELFSHNENAEEECVKKIISARYHRGSNNTSYNRNKSTPKQRRAGSAMLANSATREEHLALVATLPYSVRRGLSWHSSYHERRSHSNKSIQANAKASQRAKQEHKPEEEELLCYESPSVERKKLHRSPSVNTHTMNTTIRHPHAQNDENNDNQELTRESKNKLEKRLSSLKRAVSLSRWQQRVPQNSAEREDRAAPLSIEPYRLSASEHRAQSNIQITNKKNNYISNNKYVLEEINEEMKRNTSAKKKRTLSAKSTTTITTRTLTPSSKTSTLSSTIKKENNSANQKTKESMGENNNRSYNMKNVMRRKGSSHSTHNSHYPTIRDDNNDDINDDINKTELECVRELEYEEAVTKDAKTSSDIRNTEEEEEEETKDKNVSEKIMTPINVKTEITKIRRGSNDPNGRERFTRSSTPPERVLFEESQEKCQVVNKTEQCNTAENNIYTTKTATTDKMVEKVSNIAKNSQCTAHAQTETAKRMAVIESRVSSSTQKTKMKEKEPCVFNIITSPSSSSSSSSSTSSSYSYTSTSCAKSYTTSSDEESTATSSVSLLSKPSPFSKALLDEVPNNVNEEEEKEEELEEQLGKVHHSEDKSINTGKEATTGGINNDDKQQKSTQENKDNNVELEEEEQQQQEKEQKVEIPIEEKKSKQMNSPIYSWLSTPVRDSTEETDSSSRQTMITVTNSSNNSNNNNEIATERDKIDKEINNLHENKSEVSKLANNSINTNHSDIHENDNENSPSDDRKSRFSFFTSEIHDTNANTLLELPEKETEEQQRHDNEAVNEDKVKTDNTHTSSSSSNNNNNNNSMTMSNSGNSHTNSNTFGSSNNMSKSTENESIHHIVSTHNAKGKLHTETQSRSRLNTSSSSSPSYSSHHRRSSHHPHLTRRQIFIANRVDSMRVPHWAKRTLFEMFDFFTRARFYLVVMIVFALVYTYARTNAFNEVAATFTVTEENRPGLTFLYRYNHNKTQLPRKHPVVIIPGFITGALELWEANLPCMQEQSFITSGFRQRMFGPQMIYLILRNPQCWLDVFSTNKETGLDQDGVRVRADLGFTSVDYFVPGYWVWAKVLVNLADIGYDPQSMSVISYDWRLSPDKCQERDGLYYNIRNTIKFMAQKNKQRVVLISHSYGTNVALSFFKWAEEREHGFMSKYVAYYVNVGGTTLGVPKALSVLLLGDAKDTISIPAPARKMLDTFISQTARYNFTRTWSSLIAMLPRGCDVMPSRGLLTLPNGTMLHCREAAELVRDQCQLTNHTDCAREINKFIRTMDHLPSLPQSLNTTVMCLYGVNKYAESGYVLSGHMNALQTNTSVSSTQSQVDHGVYYDNGDGTVPLLSLSYMCRAHNGWAQNVKRVVTVEFLHNESIMSALNLRGSSVSGDHVDILGNYELIDTLLKIVSGVDEFGAQKENDIVSYKDVLSNKTVELHRRVETRLYSDVDKRIATEAQTCLRKPNIPIKPKDTAEKNPFVEE